MYFIVFIWISDVGKCVNQTVLQFNRGMLERYNLSGVSGSAPGPRGRTCPTHLTQEAP